MKVLVATRNADKCEIVRRMLAKIIPDAYLLSLADADISGDVVEVGSVSERAIQKAEYFRERLGWIDRVDEFDAVLGMDDGLSINNGEVTPNSKELTDFILKGELPIGTPVNIVRAFALIKRNELPRVEVTTVPFTFLGNPLGIKREQGKYPLSHVLAPQGWNKPVHTLSTDEEDSFNLKHASDAIKRLFL